MPQSRAAGVTETRLLTMGMPNSRSISSPTLTRFWAWQVMRSYTFWQVASSLSAMQSKREMPMVMVRISSFCSSIILMVAIISDVFNMAFSLYMRCMASKISLRCMRICTPSSLPSSFSAPTISGKLQLISLRSTNMAMVK